MTESGNKRIEDPTERLHDKLRKILALTSSPVEAESVAAAELLQQMLTAHNLSIADLEKRGQAAPGLRKQGHDLGKAAFTWKLNLAEAIAEHYFCYPLVDRTAKTVAFLGRPENVESLQMLYAWVIDQIAAIAREERRNHFVRTNEHVDPLRWQVNFGLGAVQRLRERLRELKQRQSTDSGITALVRHHQSEISDWLEENLGYRTDGRPTKRELAWDKQEEAFQSLLKSDPEAAYQQRPWLRPPTPEQQAARDKQQAKEDAKERRRSARRRERTPRYRKVDETKENQAWDARQAGKRRADDVNLQPFIEGQKPNTKEVK